MRRSRCFLQVPPRLKGVFCRSRIGLTFPLAFSSFTADHLEVEEDAGFAATMFSGLDVKGTAPLIAMLSLSACAMGGSEGVAAVCPPVVECRRAEQAQAAAEVEALPEGAALPEAAVEVRMLAD